MRLLFRLGKLQMTPIKNTPGYFITECGKVFSTIRFGRWQEPVRELKQVVDNHGYVSVRVMRNGQRVTCRVHRLLAEAFLERLPGQNIVRHLDDVKTNNALANLAWGTSADNGADMSRNGTSLKGRKIARSHHGTSNPNSKLTLEQVNEIRSSWKPGMTFASFGRRYGVTYVTIRRIIFGELWKSQAMEVSQ